ncbi:MULTISPECIES: flagellar hook-basal body complex protein FliE [Zymobacter]|nr:flagellar hook-basal body complex protein FliE [Zymobacter palmae]
MAISGVGMQNVLQMLESTSLQAGNTIGSAQNSAAQISNAQEGLSFSDTLKNSLDRIDGMRKSADAKGQAYARGDKNVQLNDVMVDMQKGSLALQMGVEVRNKVVTSYKEIMNMQV